ARPRPARAHPRAGTIASSIQSFPRGKLVLDAAPTGAAPPRLWLAETTKEELLARWMLTVRTEKPPILEHHRVTALEPAGAVRVVWSSEVIAVAPGTATLATPAGPVHVGCDSLFVMIGAEAAPAGTDLLSRLTHALQARETDPPHHAFDTR
ncbi:MAG: hypothetical protein K8M05_26340, partial [Deltaproteobacteria bacterium]|nr:hypothetical protein [Kofleriaceae bacterium]